jgi:hypothetical protein
MVSSKDVYVSQPMFADMGLEPQHYNALGQPVDATGALLPTAGKLVAPAPQETPTSYAWRVQAMEALYRVARRQATLTVDDVYAECQVRPPSPNAWGSLWAEASWATPLHGPLIKPTNEYVRSKQKQAHGRKVPVYASLVYTPPAAGVT